MLSDVTRHHNTHCYASTQENKLHYTTPLIHFTTPRILVYYWYTTDKLLVHSNQQKVPLSFHKAKILLLALVISMAHNAGTNGTQLM